MGVYLGSNKVSGKGSDVKREVMTVSLNTRQYIPKSGDIVFDKVEFTNSDRLKLENGKIVIGKGIKAVLVSHTLWCEVGGGAYSFTRLYKNDYELTKSIFPDANGGQLWRTNTATPFPANVQEGDVIKSHVTFSVENSNNQVAGSYTRSCYMTVEVIE